MRAQRIESSLREHFGGIELLEIVDESHLHAGRAGQESHFKVMVVSEAFQGLSRVQRQRQINQLLKVEFDSGLHALSMRLLTPEEFNSQSGSFQTPDCRGGERS
jgi:BolA protein